MSASEKRTVQRNSRVRVEKHDSGVRVLTLDDPDKRNAIGPEMRNALVDAANQLKADAEARCLVVTGTGASFCAGADLAVLFGEEATPAEMRRRQLSYYDSFLWLRDLPYPTISAVNGHAIGAGLNLALACDIVISGPAARFGATFSKLGLHPGGGCTYFVTRRLGPGRALKTLLLGETLDGAEAYFMRLADDFADNPLAAATALATHVAGLEPHLVQDMKRAVATAVEQPFKTSVEWESWAQAASTHYPGVQEGIRRAGRSTARRARS